MMNVNNNVNANTSAANVNAKNSSVVSSSKSAASTAHSNSSSNSASNAAKSNAKVTPREILPLDKRSSVKKVRSDVEILNITEQKGSKVQIYLVAPPYREAETIDDGRQAMTVHNGQTYLNLTTPRFQERLFHIMRNLEVDGKPAKMGWKFADKHIEAFNWIINKANSFLTDYFNPNER